MLLRGLLIGLSLLVGCVPVRPREAAPDVVVAAPASSPLKVTAVVPEPNATAVLFDSTLYVQFNHPVVPLTSLDHPISDQAVSIEPPIDGTVKWINTGLFTFAPAIGWAPETTYQLSVPSTGYRWSFSTLPPAVASTNPAPSTQLIDPSGAVRVTFNQPLDHGAVVLSLEPTAEGDSDWVDQRTLVFRTPHGLAADTQYVARVVINGRAPQTHTWTFKTAPPPTVLSTTPNSGEEAPRLGQFELSFSAPMDRDSVRANLQLDPLTDSPPYLNWSAEDTRVLVYARLKPSTAYTVRLPTATLDRFGRGLVNALELDFTTPSDTYSVNAPPVPPSAWLIGPGLIGTYNAYQHPRALVRTTNVSRLDFSIDQLDEPAVRRVFDRMRASPAQVPDGRRILSSGVDIDVERNIPSLTELDLGQLEPGWYRLRVEPKNCCATTQDRLIVVTRTMLAVKESASQVLVWATDLQSGEPVAGVNVRAFRPGGAAPYASGVTDDKGLVQLAASAIGQEPSVVIADRPGDAALTSSTWSDGVSPWSFGLQMAWNPAPVTAHVYTDRPIYKPGQTVHLKGILRADDDAHYSLPPANFTATWRMRDSRGQVVASNNLAPSDFGTFAADVDLSAEAVTGTYSVQVESGSQYLPPATFIVADYQRPTYEVNIETPGSLIAGQPLNAAMHAAYYFGQPLAGGAVHWQVTAEPYAFSWALDRTFRFGDDDQLYPRSTAPNAARAEGKGVTTSSGQLDFLTPTDLTDTMSQRFTIEATVTDKDSGDVSNRATVIVHKAGLYLGLRPTTYVPVAGRSQSIELVTLDSSGAPKPDTHVHAQIVRRRWLNVRERDASGDLRWISRPEDTPVGELDAQSGPDARGKFDFTPDDGGQYRVVLEAADAFGKTAHTALTLWVAGPGFVPWRQAEDTRLELQADKPLYRPGDVAHVLVPAPIDHAQALVTVERGKLLSYRVETLTSNSSVFDVPITGEHVPNAYVSVVLFGPGEQPATWSGYVELQVESTSRQVQVTVQADQRDHRPGDDAMITLRTRDADGNGVPAELSLAMVDAAVLALADTRADPIDAFWHRRPVGVRTASSIGSSIDRANDAVLNQHKGGGGGDQASVRADFPDTAFWAATIRTDAGGEARLSVHLPDSLTTWRMTAVAVTRDTRLGVGSADIVTSKPLLVRPIVPRFLVGGDSVTLSAAIHNNTSAAQAVTVTLRTDQLALDDASPRHALVPAGSHVTLNWRARSAIAQAGTATLHFEASAGDSLQDAIELPLPLLAWGVPSIVSTAGEVAADDTTTERIVLPTEVDHQRGELRVQVTPSLAAAMRYAAQQVEFYPYFCLEQTVSRFLPRLALHRAINGLGLGDPLHIGPDLGRLVLPSIQRIYHLQHADGGWGLWENDTSSPYHTAYALYALIQARSDGYAIDQTTLDRATAYLRTWLNADPGPYGLDGRAFVLQMLGEAGAREPNRLSALFDRRADLSPLGKASLALALAQSDPADARVGGLLSELSTQAIVSADGSHWELTSQAVRPWLLATDVRTTASVLDALVRLRPGHPLIASTVRWLMAARQDGGYWSSTHETATSLLALTDYLGATGELQGSFSWQLGVNGQPRQNASVSDVATRFGETNVVVPVPQLSTGENRVELMRSTGSGRLYYSLQLRTYEPAQAMPFLSHGFSVAREYLTATGEPLGEVHVGDLVMVRLTLLTPTDLHDVLVEEPLPAGLEPIDTRLKTTSLSVTETTRAANAPTDGTARWWQPWSHVDMRSDHVAIFANYARAGTYTYVYLARASSAGEFGVLPTNAREQYFPDIQAHSDGRRFSILP